MSLVVVGLNHRTAPVDLLERVAVPPAGLSKALDRGRCPRDPGRGRRPVHLQSHGDLRALHPFPPRGAGRARLPCRSLGLGPDDLASRCYTYFDDAAVSHLFGVAAGIDSMIVGEGEILGQVREAWHVAAGEGHAGALLDRTFQHRGRGGQAGTRPRPRSATSRRTSRRPRWHWPPNGSAPWPLARAGPRGRRSGRGRRSRWRAPGWAGSP